MAETTLTAIIQEVYVQGISTRAQQMASRSGRSSGTVVNLAAISSWRVMTRRYYS
ncbi:hypothetical protein [Magnetospirillum gryphiswaldense]|uniref:hypothetical protein n=1 Tax=Magnetospirillum gryphiswaldense TaxID=55518 RepID=UPI000A4E8640|nr:hypothetical protein [Magnetospirillum gryphiswaldense]